MVTSNFRIEWPDLKLVALHLISGDTSDFKRENNKRLALSYVQGGGWAGFSAGQLERWLKSGFQTDAIHGLEDFIPPIREKRKLRFAEEGDEFHYDIAASGDDNYMSEWTKRDEIPGLAISADIAIVGGVGSSILNAYYTWLCRVAFSIEAAGVDTEISLYSRVNRLFKGGNEITHTLIRVKKENEATDFLSWSAMLSPASLRGLGFIAQTLHADSRNRDVSPGQGGRIDKTGWHTEFQPDSRTLTVTCDGNSNIGFPETKMTESLRHSLRSATQKG